MIMSNEDVEQLIRKRIQTTMIGALARFEENFGHLWGHYKDPSEPLTPEEEKFADTWDYTRNQILNQGNSQIRNLSKDLQNAINGNSNQTRYQYNFGKPRERRG
jgi:hypothetical protein